MPSTVKKGAKKSSVRARRKVEAPTESVSASTAFDLLESSLQGHFSPGFVGVGLWSECPRSCFDFAGWCLWAQHGLVIRAVPAEDWEIGAGPAGREGDANN